MDRVNLFRYKMDPHFSNTNRIVSSKTLGLQNDDCGYLDVLYADDSGVFSTRNIPLGVGYDLFGRTVFGTVSYSF